MVRRFASLLLLFSTLILLLAAPRPANAGVGSAADLIAAVNALRASYGLEPYVVDAGLMQIAQEHSDYQASIRTRTHTRADGSGPGDHGISSENIGGGVNVSPQDLIQFQWTDYWHMHTLIGYTSGLVGAGVSVVDGYAFYTLDVKNTGTMSGLPAASTPAATSASGSSATSVSQPQTEARATSTPLEDGSQRHLVQLGETLWSIAQLYGYTVEELATLNGLSPTNPIIYEGQDLLIRRPYTPTATSTITPTPTKTLRPTRTLRPLDATFTLAAPYATTEAPLLPESDNPPSNLRSVGILVVAVSVLGILGVLVSRWWSNKTQ